MDTRRYNAGARTFHWLIALLVLINIAIGLFHEPIEKTVNLMPLHISIGLTVLLLSVARLVWRMTWTKPPYPAAMSPLEARLAGATHALFYVLMIGMPITGWLMVSAGNQPISYFGLFNWPKFGVTRDSFAAGFGHEAHEIGAWVFIALIVLHVAAALRHHFLLKDDVLKRML